MSEIYVNGNKLRKPRDDTTPEYREAVVRDHVKANPGKVIQIADFRRVLDDYSGTSKLIVKLISQGKLIRRNDPFTPGKAYTYQWHDTLSTDEVVQVLRQGNGPVKITRKWYATDLQLKQLDDWFHDYCNSEDSVDGANRFRKFVHSKAKEEA